MLGEHNLQISESEIRRNVHCPGKFCQERLIEYLHKIGNIKEEMEDSLVKK